MVEVVDRSQNGGAEDNIDNGGDSAGTGRRRDKGRFVVEGRL